MLPFSSISKPRIAHLATTLALLLLSKATNGLSTGAASCSGGEAAVGAQHFSGEVTTGSLSDSPTGLKVLLDGKPLSETEPTDFSIGREYALNVQGNDAFLGFLLRLGSGENNADTTDALYVAPENSVVQIASAVCVNGEGVGGLTHTNNLPKTGVAGTLQMDEVDTSMHLDVTVVIRNRNGVSTYYYSRYMLNAVEGPATSDNGPSMEDMESGAATIFNSVLLVIGIGLLGVLGF